jgi:hypothetical protein
MQNGRTTVVVAHRLSTIINADDIAGAQGPLLCLLLFLLLLCGPLLCWNAHASMQHWLAARAECSWRMLVA